MDNLALTFAAEEISLSVRSFSVEERINQPFEISLIAVSEQQEIDLDLLVGHRAGFQLALERGPLSHRTWTGVCSHADLLEVEPNGVATYYVRVVPEVWRMTLRQVARIFQHQSAVEIACKVLADYDIVPELWLDPKRFPQLEYRAQYCESDFAFMSRILEEAGISYYFRQVELTEEEQQRRDDERASRRSRDKRKDRDEPHKHPVETRLILCDEPQLSEPREGGAIPFFSDADETSGREMVTQVRVAHRLRPGKVTIRDYDFRTRPDFQLISEARTEARLEERYEQFQYLPGAFLVEKRGHAATDQGEGDAMSQRRLRAARGDRRTVVYDTNAFDISPGVVFCISDHPRPELRDKTRLMVVRQTIEGTRNERWYSSGEAVFTEEAFRPALVTPKPRMAGVQSALVVGPKGEEIHTDEHGRVRVQFHWDREGGHDDHSSCWIRVSQAWAGKGYGIIAIPRVGEEVLVDFFEGDPDQPIVVGRVYNGTARAPYPLPEHRTRTVWRTDTSPGGGAFHELSFEAKKGREGIHLRAERSMKKLVNGNENATITECLSTEVQKDEQRKVGGNQALTIDGSRSSNVKGDESISVGGTFALASNQKTGAIMRPDGSLVLTNGQASIVLSGPNIYLDARGHIRANAGQVCALFGGEVHVAGRPNVYINATVAPMPCPIPLLRADVRHRDRLTEEERRFRDTLRGRPSRVQPPRGINEQLQVYAVAVGDNGVIFVVLKSDAELERDRDRRRRELDKRRDDDEYVDLRPRAEAEKQRALGRYNQEEGKLNTIEARTHAALERLRGAAKKKVAQVEARIERAKAQITGRVKGMLGRLVAAKENVFRRFEAFKAQAARVHKSLVDFKLENLDDLVREVYQLWKQFQEGVKSIAREAKQLVESVKRDIGLIGDDFKDAVNDIAEMFGLDGPFEDPVPAHGGHAPPAHGGGGAPPPHQPPPHPPPPAHPGHHKTLEGGANMGKLKDVHDAQTVSPDYERLKGQANYQKVHGPVGGDGNVDPTRLAGARGDADPNWLDRAKDGAGQAEHGGQGHARPDWLDRAKDGAGQAEGQGGHGGQGADWLDRAKDGAGDAEGQAGHTGSEGSSWMDRVKEGADGAESESSGAQSPMADSTLFTRSGGLGGDEVGQAVNHTPGTAFVQSPSEGQLMIVRGEGAQAIDPDVLQSHVVESQMRGVPVGDSLAEHLSQNGYSVYQRPWGNYTDDFVLRQAASTAGGA